MNGIPMNVMHEFTLSGDNKIIVEDDAEIVRESNGFHIRCKNPTPAPPVSGTSNVNILGTVAVVNQSTTDSDAAVQSWINAVKIQADRDISRFWGGSVDFQFVGKANPPPADWYCIVTDNADVAGALGYHDVAANGEPIIKVFTEFEAQGAGPSSVTLSHEIAESIGDTNANTTIQGYDENGKACLYFRENCDPVENNTYTINGIEVSDFITPSWFINGSTAQLDYLNAVSRPYQILSGGYMEISYDGGQTWNQINKNSKRASMHEGDDSRYALYKKRIDQRKVSTFKIAEV